jgi:hypothetical protein
MIQMDGDVSSESEEGREDASDDFGVDGPVPSKVGLLNSA